MGINGKLNFARLRAPILLTLLVFGQAGSADQPATCPFSEPDRCARWQATLDARNEIYKPVDANTLSEVKIPCEKSGGVLGALDCDDGKKGPGFYSAAEAATKRILATRNSGTYRGSASNPAGGYAKLSATPVCMISQGELDHNWLPKGNSAAGCGAMCGISISTGMFSATVATDDQAGHCDWEYGQYRGAVIQAQNFYKEQVFKELRGGTIKLMDVDGTRPCAEIASDVVQMAQGLKDTTKIIADGMGDPAALAKLDCPIFNPPAGPSGGTQSLKDVAAQMNPASHGACKMFNANLNQVSIWGKLLECEIFWRAGKVFEDQFGSPDDFVKEIKAFIQPLCEEAGHCNKGGVSQCSGPLCCKDEMRTKLFKDCYKANVPNYIKKKVQMWPTTTPIELPAGIPNPKTSQNDATGFGLAIGALTGIRRRPKACRRSRRAQLLLLLLLALLLAAFGAGCSCDDNNATCKPCIPANQQSKGCLYKVCMQALYFCTQKNQGDWAGSHHTTAHHVSTDEADGMGGDGTGFNLGHVFTDLVGVGHDEIHCLTADPKAAFNPAMLNVFEHPEIACWTHKEKHFIDEVTADSQTIFKANVGADIAMAGALTAGAVTAGFTGGVSLAGAMLAVNAIAVGAGAGAVIGGDAIGLASEGGNTNVTGGFLKSHALSEVGLNNARETCRQVAGIPKGDSSDKKNYDATADNMNASILSDAQKTAFQDVLTQRMHGDQMGAQGTTPTAGASGGSGGGLVTFNSAADPSCTHANPATTQTPLGPANSSPAAGDMADARSLFGATPIAAKNPSATGGGASRATNAATAGTKNAPAAGGLGTPKGTDSGKAPGAGHTPMVAGAGTTTGGGAGGGLNMGGGADSSGSADAAGSSGDIGAGQASDFAAAAAAAAGRAGPGKSGMDSAGGGTAGLSGVDFGNKGGVENAVTDADGIIKDSKLSLFIIVNKRTDKYSRDNGF